MKHYSLLLKNGTIVNAERSAVNGRVDIALDGDTIAAIEPDLNPDAAHECIDVQGLTLIPGIIDGHVHVSRIFGGLEGHRMLARAGVTTSVDMAGPSRDVFMGLQSHGTGLNMLSVEAFIPGRQLSSTNPARCELEDQLQRARNEGSLGLKIIGEPYGLTPEATGEAIALCADERNYCAIHAGTTRNPSNLHGFCEILELAGTLPLYLAHINVYCRGQTASPAEESERALARLAEHPQIYTDSYLSQYNACSAKIVAGVPKSPFTRNALQLLGLSATEAGLREALLQGQLAVAVVRDGERQQLFGPEAVEHWEAAGTRIDAFAAINPLESRVRLATATFTNGARCGAFVVDALASDGGGLPRNVIVAHGLSLVQSGGLSLEDFVRKTSFNQARMLGLSGKGRLAEGSDADITGLDLERGKAVLSVAGGQVVLREGHLCAKGGTAYVLEEGAAFTRNLGLKTRLLNRELLLPSR